MRQPILCLFSLALVSQPAVFAAEKPVALSGASFIAERNRGFNTCRPACGQDDRTQGRAEQNH